MDRLEDIYFMEKMIIIMLCILGLALLFIPSTSATMQISLNQTNVTFDAGTGVQYGIFFLNGTFYIQPVNFTIVNYSNYTIYNSYNVTNITNITYNNYTGNFTFINNATTNYTNYTTITYSNFTDGYTKYEIDSKLSGIYVKSEVDAKIIQPQNANLTALEEKIDAKSSHTWLWIISIINICLLLLVVFFIARMGA